MDSYECDQRTAQAEFLLSKKLYTQKTGRDQGKHDVIAYHIRMSFKPGEVSAEKALELGRELAMRWTRGKHQFIVAAHTNTNNPHVHIIYNSVNLEHSGKYQDFKGSSFALRRVSDQICLEHGLSVIENPGLSKGRNRDEYLGVSKPPTVREKLQNIFDEVIPSCVNYDDFINALQARGVEIKFGKQHSYKLPDAKRFIRQDTLGDDYSLAAVLERLSGKRVVQVKQKAEPPKIQKPNLLIDIQSKMQQGYGAGFEQFAKIHNIKEMAKTLLFLQERGLDDYDLLTAKTNEVSAGFSVKATRIKEIESRLKDISELQRHIGAYSKHRETYAEYLRLKKIPLTSFQKLKKIAHPSDEFYEKNYQGIALYKASKKFFGEQGYVGDKKLPTINMLKKEYAVLDKEKRGLYLGYKEHREEMVALKMAKQNVDRIFAEPKAPIKNRGHERGL